MKRNLFFILVAILISLSLSQGSFAAGFENPYKIQVRRLSWFKPEYLTITYAGTFNILENYGYYSFDPSTGKKGTNNFTKPKDKIIANLSLFNHLTHNKYKDLCWEPIENLFGCLTTNPHISTYPAIYSIVLKVDSIDAKDWDESMFYKTVRDGKRHEIELLSFSGKNYTITIDDSYIPPYGELLKDSFYSDSPTSKTIFSATLSDYEQGDFLIHKYYESGKLSILWDKDVDWSKYKTYDLALRGTDPLTDKELFEIISNNLSNGNMKRDTDNPDIIITISKKANESISYAYVPPTSKVVTTGSHTKRVYNWVGQFQEYRTINDAEVIREGGYEKELAQSSIFYEVCMLDASKLDNTVPPIIYQLKYDWTTNRKIDAMNIYKSLSSYVETPIMGVLKPQHYLISLTKPKYKTYDSGTIYYIHPESEAYMEHGLRTGDRIKKIKVVQHEYAEIQTIRNKKKYKIRLYGYYPYSELSKFKEFLPFGSIDLRTYYIPDDI